MQVAQKLFGIIDFCIFFPSTSCSEKSIRSLSLSLKTALARLNSTFLCLFVLYLSFDQAQFSKCLLDKFIRLSCHDLHKLSSMSNAACAAESALSNS